MKKRFGEKYLVVLIFVVVLILAVYGYYSDSVSLGPSVKNVIPPTKGTVDDGTGFFGTGVSCVTPPAGMINWLTADALGPSSYFEQSFNLTNNYPWERFFFLDSFYDVEVITATDTSVVVGIIFGVNELIFKEVAEGTSESFLYFDVEVVDVETGGQNQTDLSYSAQIRVTATAKVVEDIKSPEKDIGSGGISSVTGMVDEGISFDGVDDYVRIPRKMKHFGHVGSVTVDAWVKPDSTGNFEGIVWSGSYKLTRNLGGFIFFSTILEDQESLIVSDIPVEQGVWSHVAGTYDENSGTQRIYINGVLASESSGISQPLHESRSSVFIGAERDVDFSNYLDYFFDGTIDEVEIFDRALDQSEIQSIYDAGSAGKCKEPILLPVDCDPIVINDGDAFFGDNDWKWVLRNLDQNTQTQIDSTTQISGPTIGIANDFRGVDLNGRVLAEPSRGEGYDSESWALPNDYISLVYGSVWPNEEDERGSSEIMVRHVVVDFSEAVGIPTEYKRFLGRETNVISLSVDSGELASYNNVPSIMLNWQTEHIGLGDYIFADNNYDDNVWYYAVFYDVNPRGTISFKVNKVDCSPIYPYCQYGRIPEMDFYINPREEVTFLNKKIYNWYSGWNSSGWNLKSWAVISSYLSEGEELVDVSSTNRLVYFPFTDPVDLRMKVLVFYEDYLVGGGGELVYLEAIDLEDSVQYRSNARIDYYHGEGKIGLIRIREGGKDYLGLIFSQEIYSENISEDNIFAKFRYDKERGVMSFGDLSNRLESNELIYYYSSYPDNYEYPGLDSIEIGVKSEDSKTAYGTRINSPKKYSIEKDGVLFNVFSRRVYASTRLEKPGLCLVDGGFTNEDVGLGNNIFLSPFTHNPWFPWMFDDTTIQDPQINPLKLKRWNVNYAGQNLEMHEALVFGTETPSVETSLTTQLDEYKDKVYFEIEEAYDSNGYPNAGIKLFNSFDSQVDLNSLSESNKIPIYLSGKYFDIIGYNSPTSLTIKPYCSEPTCGNDFLEVGEECDGKFMGGASCNNFGFEWGELNCVPRGEPEECTIITSCCFNSICGNGVIDSGEQCDSSDLDGRTCISILGWTHGGALQCNTDCTFNLSFCYYCGNGIVEGEEECDDGGYGGPDPLDTCSNDCHHIEVWGNCGDGSVDVGEDCDDGNNEDGDGCPADCRADSCGNGICETDEVCCFADCPGPAPNICPR